MATTTTGSRLAALALGTILALVVALVFGPLPRESGATSGVATLDPHFPPSADGRSWPRAEADVFLHALLEDMDRRPGPEWAGFHAWSDGYDSMVMTLGRDALHFVHRSCIGEVELAFGEVKWAAGPRS